MKLNTLPFQYALRGSRLAELDGQMLAAAHEQRDRDLEDYLGIVRADTSVAVPATRSISTTLPLTGGGDLSADRTLAVNVFTAGIKGVVPPPGTVDGTRSLRDDGTWITAFTQAVADARYVNIPGDTMTGDLIIANPATLGFAATPRQAINLYNTTYGIGVQTNCGYFRSANSFAFFIGGSHSDTKFDPGAGGVRGPVIDAAGWMMLGKTAGAAAGTLGIELQGSTGNISATTNTAGVLNAWFNKIGGSNLAGEIYARFSVAAAGTVAGEIKLVAGPGVTYGTTSDRRMKRLIAPVEGATERVRRLKVWHFAWKADDVEQDGFVADEVAEVVPDAVSGEPDAVDDEGQIVPQQLDQARLVPLLTAALQEALERIDVLEDKVRHLEAA